MDCVVYRHLFKCQSELFTKASDSISIATGIHPDAPSPCRHHSFSERSNRLTVSFCSPEIPDVTIIMLWYEQKSNTGTMQDGEKSNY